MIDNTEATYVPSRRELAIAGVWHEHLETVKTSADGCLVLTTALVDLYEAEMRYEDARKVLLSLPVPGASGEAMNAASKELRDAGLAIVSARDAITELLG